MHVYVALQARRHVYACVYVKFVCMYKNELLYITRAVPLFTCS